MGFKKIVMLSILLVLLSGCGSSLQNVTKNVKSGAKKVVSSSDMSLPDKKEDIDKLYKENLDINNTSDLLWNYKAGTIAILNAKYKDSIFYFDRAEELIKKYDEEVLASKALANIGAILTNDRFMDYRPKIYEKIMVNSIKGLDFIFQKDKNNARIELNRALVRQERAVEFFKKEISKLKQEMEKEKESKDANKTARVDYNKIIKNKKTTDPIEKKYKNLFAFKPYRDFVNPFVTYLSGIYFLASNDYRKATDLLKESYGMIKGIDDGDKYVLSDFKLASRLKSSTKSRKEHYVWIIFFNGLGPIKEELRIDIPLFLFTNDVAYTGIALPTLKIRKKAFEYLEIKVPGYNKIRTKTITSMDRIIKAEFKKRFPYIMQRALIRTVVQTVIQKQVNDKLEKGMMGAGPFGYLLAKGITAGAQYMLTRADTRMWDSLPKEFQVARVPAKNSLLIYTPSGKLIKKVNINKNKNHIIFINIPTSQSDPVVFVADI